VAGKTSFIKAVANHLKRHIVSIPLARLETNEELVDLMFDLSFKVRRRSEGTHPLGASARA
jgi:mitochondrial chaperone BCS1